MSSDRNIRNFASDSQNFTLRVSLSEDSIVEDTQDVVADNKKERKENVIVISDSSSGSSFEDFGKQDWKLASASKRKNKKKTRYQKLQILETSSSSESDDERSNSQWRRLINTDNKSLDKKYVNKNTVQIINTFYAVDETTTKSSRLSCDRESDRTKKSYESPVMTPAKQRVREDNINLNKIHRTYRVRQMEKETTSSHSTCSESPNMFGKLDKFPVRNTPQYDYIGKTKLTKQDARKALKNIRSMQVVYNSPREKGESNVIIDESTDEDESIMHPAISPANNGELNRRSDSPDVIETSLKDDIVPDSQMDLPKYKKHIDKLPETPTQEEFHRPLSEKKKRQIAEWLLTNPSDSQSDGSCSNIPPSVRNSRGSGNSSLERLELLYETPNNRGKFNEAHVNEKKSTATRYDGTIQLSSTRQTALNKFFKTPRNDGRKFCTLGSSKSLPKTHTEKISSPPVVNTLENANVKECANILDKLYGESWRDKANVLLPTSVPRNRCIQNTNRLIQTERKHDLKNRYCADSDKNTVERNVKTNPGTKIQQGYKKKTSSFINDESLSSNTSESIYHTALTNPRTSTNNDHNNTPPKQEPRKPLFLGICDTDTDTGNELDDGSSNNSEKSLRRKRLSFSDDESSNTSEFDPGDYVPPKYISKKEVIKAPRTPKVTPKTMDRTIGYNSFLGSLSDKVSLNNAHPNAKKYRMDYRNKKEELCKELYKLYNEKVFDNKLPVDMPIEWNIRMRGTAGFCYNKKSVKTLTGTVKSSRIVLATKILDTPDRLRDTLIHEMCHAASWLINDVLDGHGPFWTAWANKARTAFPELPPILRCHDYEIKTKFTYKCTGCGYSIGRHSKSLNIEQKRCGHCYGKFELLINKTTKSGTVQMQTPNREPSGFALYVKQNYNSVKRERNNIRHAEVMKILGQQFSAIKIAKTKDLTAKDD